MQKLLILGVLLAATLAGCLSESGEGSGLGTSPETYTVPEVPFGDASVALDDLLFYTTTYGERAGNTEAHEGSRVWKQQEFAKLGFDVFSHHFENGIPQQNIVGFQEGVHKDKWVVIGGHYDMTTTDCALQCVTRPFSQGAYDDGSGTMMTVELARAFADTKPFYSIAWTLFDGEERGLQGSTAFRDALITGEMECLFQNDPAQDNLVEFEGTEQFCVDGPVEVMGMVNLDMIGLNWPGVDAPIYFDSNSADLDAFLMEVQADLGIPEDMIKYQGISLGRSDYARFFEIGVPTGFFISDFEEWQLPADIPVTLPPLPQSAYPFWHLQDTYETMILMAGSEQDAIDGFQTAMDLSSYLLHLMAMQPQVQLSAVVA